jgi:hypothetical protein
MIWVLNFHSVLSQLTSPCYNTRLKVRFTVKNWPEQLAKNDPSKRLESAI